MNAETTSMPGGEFTGKVVVVTGGAGGIGAAVVRAFSAEGAALAVLDVRQAEADRVASEIQDSGRSALALGLDVADELAAHSAIATIVERFGRLDVLVNIAGGSLNTPSTLQELTADDFRRVLDVNVIGTFVMCKAAAPHLQKTKGSIVNMSSLAGRTAAGRASAAYAAAKAAIVGMTRRLASELGPAGVCVNAVAPGLFISTNGLQEMWDGYEDIEREGILAAIPLNRMPELRELVEPILFLAGAASTFMTGTVIDINGGRFMSG